MPYLDERLKTVARTIRSDVHADIGSDHGHLLHALLAAGRIRKGIAIENKLAPYENSRAELGGLNAEVRLGDGLTPLYPGEVDSLSLCGMGGELIARILRAHPDRVPGEVVVQANQDARCVRRWAKTSGYHLSGETLTEGKRLFLVMALTQAPDGRPDPVYEGIDEIAAEIFGPHLIRCRDGKLWARLRAEKAYWNQQQALGDEAQERLDAIERLLAI